MKTLENLQLLVSLLKEFELPISPILEFAIKEIEESLSSSKTQSIIKEEFLVDNSVSTNVSESIETTKTSVPYCQHPSGNKHAKLRIYRSDGSFIQDNKVANTFAQAIKEIGPKKVHDLNISSDGMNLVTIGGNPQYPSAQKNVGGGFYVNTHSGTMWKKQILERIFHSLDLSWKVKLVYE